MKQSKSSRSDTFVKLFSIFLGLAFYMAEGINYSQLGPFFPTEAGNKKRVSVSMIGVITGAFDVANLIAVFALSKIISKNNQKFFFCTGALLSASCTVLFGVMGWSIGGITFTSLCILIRFTMGAGASMVWSTGVPLLVPIYPQWEGKIVSLVQTALGLGSMVGPTIGSSLYSLGGYSLPFIAAGIVEIAIGVLAIIFLPDGSSSQIQASNREPDQPELEDQPGYTFLYFVTRPQLLLLSISMMLICSASGFLDVAIGPYLDEQFGIGGDKSGYYFLAFSVLYLVASPVLAFLVDKGQSGKTFIACSFISGFGFLMMWLPDIVPSLESEIWLVFWLAAQGFACCGGFIPSYLLYEKLAYKVGFKSVSKAKLMTSATLNICFAIGRILGPIVIGGVFKQYYGYYNACLLQAVLSLLMTFFAAVTCYQLGFLGSLYYPQKGDGAPIAVSCDVLEEQLSISFRGTDEGSDIDRLIVKSGRFSSLSSVSFQRRQ